MREDMGRVLVCYATGTGCTTGVAERIGETLASARARVDVVPFESNPDPAGYDAVVAGSGTRARSWHPVAKKWMTRNASALRARPLVLFTVCMAAATEPENAHETLGVTDRLLAKTGLDPLDIGVFAGWYEPRKLNFFERKAMEMHKAPVGDFRDWKAIERWATHVAPKLTSVRRVAVA